LENLSYDPSGRGLFTGAGGLGGTTRLRPEAAEAALTVAPFVGPAAKVGVRGAMVTGRALGPTAAGMAERYMQRQGMMPSLNVFHGSPYKFDKFDSSKIGTGEGNQTYGYGLYLAENPAVANDYKRQLSSEFFWRDLDAALPTALKGKAPDWTDALLSGKTVDDLASTLKRPWEKSLLQQNKAKIESVIDAHKASGNVYQVDLPDEQIAKMLDYDKPLSKQAPEIKAKLKAVVDDQMGAGMWDQWIKSEPEFRNLDNDLFEDKTPEEISALLREAGIPGIRYLDQGSRGAGKGTSNFVVFPGMEDTLRIMRRNEEAVNPMFADPFANTIDDTTR
jgi:hypothetical protein